MQSPPLKSANSKYSPFPDTEKASSKTKTVNVFFPKTLIIFAFAFLKVLKG